MRTFLLTFHIVGAGAWIGAHVAQFVSTKRITARGGDVAAAWMETIELWGKTLYSPAAVVILATGIGLVIDSPFYDFSNAFVSIGFVAIVAGAAIGIGLIAKGSGRAAVAFAGGDDAAGRAEAAKAMQWSAVDSAILVVTLLAMVAKWGV